MLLSEVIARQRHLNHQLDIKNENLLYYKLYYEEIVYHTFNRTNSIETLRLGDTLSEILLRCATKKVSPHIRRDEPSTVVTAGALTSRLRPRNEHQFLHKSN